MMKWIEFCVGLICVHCRCALMLRVGMVELLIERGWWDSRRVSGKEKDWEKRKKGKEGEKWFEEKEFLFVFV